MIYDTQVSLKQIIDNKITENQNLEYKQDIFKDGKFDNKAKYKILKEITALNCTPFVRQVWYNILVLRNGVFFYAKKRTE